MTCSRSAASGWRLFEIEQALISHPNVLEAAVVPARDEDGLEKPKAFVVLKSGVAADDLDAELKEHVKARVGKWKYPRWIEFTGELPKTATGKIQRFKLKESVNVPAFDWRGGASGFLTIGGKRLENSSAAAPRRTRRPRSSMLHEGLGCVALWRDFPEQLAAATGLGVFAYSRAGYGHQTVSLPRPLDYMTREARETLPTVLEAIRFRAR